GPAAGRCSPRAPARRGGPAARRPRPPPPRARPRPPARPARGGPSSAGNPRGPPPPRRRTRRPRGRARRARHTPRGPPSRAGPADRAPTRRRRCSRPRGARRRASSAPAARRPRTRRPAARRRRRSQELPQPRLELATGVVEPAHHRALRTVQDSADLLVGEGLHLAEEYDRAVIGGQLAHRLLDAPADLGAPGALEGLVRGWAVGRERRADLPRLFLLGAELAELALAALLVDAEVEGNAVEPGIEAGVALEAVEVLVSPREGLLHDIEGVFPVPEHAYRERGHPALVPLDQLAERVPITLTGAQDELPIARRHGPQTSDGPQAADIHGRREPPSRQCASAQLAPWRTSTRRGTRSGQTFSMASRTRAAAGSTSASGTSSTSSSCTWSRRRPPRPASAS